jgi:uncharacterized membrane protein YqhA
MAKLLSYVFSMRFLAIVAVIAPFFGAALMLLYGVQNTVEAYLTYFGRMQPEGAVEAGEAAMIKLVASIDHFIFAAILMIFAIGIYALIFHSAVHSDQKDAHKKMPSWNHLKNLGGMDEMLLKVIIMLLSVSFLEFLLTSGIGNLDWTALVVPLTIIALAIGLRWMISASAEEEQADKPTETITVQGSYLDAMERLANLHERGALTDAEFVEAKEGLKQ